MDLVHDLADAQVSREAHGTGGAETTSHGAADLGGDAEGAPPALFVGHVDRLDRLPIHGTPAKLDGPIAGALLVVEDEGPQVELLAHPLAQALGKIAHLLEGGRPALMEPSEDLIRAKGTLPPGGEERAQLLQGQGARIDGGGLGGVDDGKALAHAGSGLAIAWFWRGCNGIPFTATPTYGPRWRSSSLQPPEDRSQRSAQGRPPPPRSGAGPPRAPPPPSLG